MKYTNLTAKILTCGIVCLSVLVGCSSGGSPAQAPDQFQPVVGDELDESDKVDRSSKAKRSEGES